MEAVLASSSVDADIISWDLRSGTELFRHGSCASPPHGLASVAGRFLASSQPRSNSSSALISFWSWDKQVKRFPVEPILPLLSAADGSLLIAGGASSGSIYIWQLYNGAMLTKWNAHYRGVTCLALSEDGSLLISGSEDGSVKVWNLIMMLDDVGKAAATTLYMHSFSEHTLRVTDVVVGIGSCNSLIISSSEDRTCKIWNLFGGKLLRSITFPCIINTIAMEPAESTFYAGGRDGKIYIAALNGECNPNSSYGKFIVGSLSEHSKVITCLTFSVDGVTLVSGSEDGTVRVWDTKSRHVIRMLKHAKGPVSNVLIVKQPLRRIPHGVSGAQDSISKRHMHSLPTSLDKYLNSTDGDAASKAIAVRQPTWHNPQESRYQNLCLMKYLMEELQKQGSSGNMEMELENSRLECKRSKQMVEQWKKLYTDLQDVCVNELLQEELELSDS